MLNTSTSAIQSNRPKAVVDLARRFGNCWVVLKGYQTILGRETGGCYINSTGNPFLAQGGSGDVLAGYLGGLLAQSALQSDPLRTLRYGVWEHGTAADWLSGKQRNWTLEDLIRTLGTVAGVG
jgi:NAD(P)H-hydrate epimerase